MFKSFKSDIWSGVITIIDSDFEETISINDDRGLGRYIIDLYEEKNLPVATNLVLAFQYYIKLYDVNIGFIISENKKLNPKYTKYEKDVEKYLLLL